MKAVAADTDYYKRLLKKLDGEETQIEAIQQEIAGQSAERNAVQKQLDDYLEKLTVESP